LFAVWVRIVKLRKIRIGKSVEVRKVKDVMKLYKILNGELYLLSEWGELERRNQESIARLTRKLSAFSTIIPFTYLKVYIFLFHITIYNLLYLAINYIQ